MRIVIVEDEAMVAQRIARLTRALLGERITALEICPQLADARRVLAAEPPDLLLLDLNVNGEDGFDLLVPLLAEPFHVIVISAYKDLALRAFEYGILDFVPKPVTPERLGAAFERFDGRAASARPAPRRLAIKRAGQIDLVELDQVVHIRGAADYSEIVLRSGKTHLCDKSLDTLASLLGGEFTRIHRSHIVRAGEIVALHTAEGSRYQAELRDGTRLPIGRTRVAALRGELAL